MSDVKLNGIDVMAKSVASSSSKKTDGVGVNAESVASAPEAVDQLAKRRQLNEVSSGVENARAEASKEQVEEAVTQLNDYVQNVERNLQFNLDDESGKTVITVVDRQTSEVIRQIPDEVVLKLAQDLQQDEPLSLFNAKV